MLNRDSAPHATDGVRLFRPVLRAGTATDTVRERDGDYATGSPGAGRECFPPSVCSWAWQHYLTACANHWDPRDVDLTPDAAMWADPHGLTHDERAMVALGIDLLSSAGTRLAVERMPAIGRHITANECRQYLARQAFEMATHAHAGMRIAGALGLDRGNSALSANPPAITDKIDWTLLHTGRLTGKPETTDERQGGQSLLRGLVALFAIHQGLFHQVASIQILSLACRGKLPGVAELVRYILRDLDTQVRFGIDLIAQIKLGNPALWTDGLQAELAAMLREGTRLATAYAYDTLPRGILGLNAPMFEEYLRFVVNRRSAQLGLPEQYPGASNPFPWLAQQRQVRGGMEAGPVTANTEPARIQLTWDE